MTTIKTQTTMHDAIRNAAEVYVWNAARNLFVAIPKCTAHAMTNTAKNVADFAAYKCYNKARDAYSVRFVNV